MSPTVEFGLAMTRWAGPLSSSGGPPSGARLSLSSGPPLLSPTIVFLSSKNHPPIWSDWYSNYSHSISEEVKLDRRSGRGIRRLVTSCGTVTQLVAEHDRWFPGSESDDDSDNEDISPQKKAEVQR